jgi:ubiquinone/menaquinone biosynthesis C-methylase UbiE
MDDNDRVDPQLAGYFGSQTRFWREVYSPAVRGISLDHRAVVRRRAAVLDYVDDYAGGSPIRVLDVGCGAGMFMAPMLERGHWVHGVDVTKAMTTEAARTVKPYLGGRASLSVGSVEALGFADGSFDVSVCIGVLQYLRSDELAVGQLARVTRPGGRVIVSLPNIARLSVCFDPYYWLWRGPRFVLHKVFGVKVRSKEPSFYREVKANTGFRDRRYFYGQLDGVLARNGLEVCGTKAIGFAPPTVWRKEFLPRVVSVGLGDSIERLAALRCCSALRLAADRWVIALEKRRSS